MKSSEKIKNISVILLTAILVFSLCSCKKKNGDKTVSGSESATVTSETVSVTQSETEASETAESVTETTQTPAVTEQPTESTVTEPITQPVTDAVVVTGTQTVTDGNKTVVFPSALNASQSEYPVIVWANGTGCPTQAYLSLLSALANGGYIVVADSNVMTADGTSQIDSINYIINKGNDSSSVFYNKVNSSAIGACGHSQGGRSSVNAAQADNRIRCIVSISGASSADESRGLKTPSLFLTGTSDLVVVSSQWCKPSYDAVSGRAAYASLKGGIHTTCMTNPEKVSGYAISWFDAYLKNDSTAKAVFENGGKLSTDGSWQDFQCKN